MATNVSNSKEEKQHTLLINFMGTSTDDLLQNVFLMAVENTVYTYKTQSENTFRFRATEEVLNSFRTLLKTKLSAEDYEKLNITAIF